MARSTVDLVVCDVVGTVIRDSGFVVRCFQDVVAASGRTASKDEIDRVRGASKRDAFARLLGMKAGDVRVAAAADDFHRRLRDLAANGEIQRIDGVDEWLRALTSSGVQVALNTGLDRETVHAMLEPLGWTAGQGLVAAVVSADDVEHGRPEPDLIHFAMTKTGCRDVSRIACIGDTTADLEAGARAGARFNVGVLTGAHTEGQLTGSPHTHIVAKAPDTLALFV